MIHSLNITTPMAPPAVAVAQPWAALPPQIERLQRAWNTHDLALLADCLMAGYESLHPLRPERSFLGREAAVTNWQRLFDAVPDFRAELLRYSVNGNEVWTEWQWRGTYLAGNAFNAGGVMVFSVLAERIARARVYTEIMAPVGPDWDAVLEDILQQSAEA